MFADGTDYVGMVGEDGTDSWKTVFMSENSLDSTESLSKNSAVTVKPELALHTLGVNGNEVHTQTT